MSLSGPFERFVDASPVSVMVLDPDDEQEIHILTNLSKTAADALKVAEVLGCSIQTIGRGTNELDQPCPRRSPLPWRF
jgi:Trp operon repressor